MLVQGHGFQDLASAHSVGNFGVLIPDIYVCVSGPSASPSLGSQAWAGYTENAQQQIDYLCKGSSVCCKHSDSMLILDVWGHFPEF